MAERADDRLVRLLGIVAYLDGAGPVEVDDLARQFGVSPARIREDIDALWVTGTPGYMPDDLIDFDAFSLDEGLVNLTQARGLTRPLRLGTREAVALVAALRAMSTTPAVQADPQRAAVVASALDKLSTATGEAASAVDVRLGGEGDTRLVGELTRALAAGRRVRLRYVDAADVTSERDVDPWRLVTQSDATYLVGWCHRAGGRRTFRLDRVLDVVVGDEPIAQGADDVATDVFAQVASEASRSPRVVTLRLASAARWIAEEVPVERVTDLPDGSFEVRLRVTNPAWLSRLLLTHARDVLAVEPGDVATDVASAARAPRSLYVEP
jgi:proteasome accessory factor C